MVHPSCHEPNQIKVHRGVPIMDQLELLYNHTYN